MCLIVAKYGATPGEFSLDNFERSHSRNSDGMGIMYLEDGRVRVERVLGALKQQRKVYQKHMNKPLFVLHQRFATHGAKNKMMENCHPFKVMDEDDGDPMDIYMAHNGVIHNAEVTDDKMSDTWNFVENHLKPIIKARPELLWDKGVQKMISQFVGTNKLVFLTNANNPDFSPILIFNKSQGSEVNGCWLSNTHSIAQTGRQVFQSHFGRSNSEWDDDNYYYRHYGKNTYNQDFEWQWDNDTKKYKIDDQEFDTWKEVTAYRLAKEEEEKAAAEATVEENSVANATLIDVAGNPLFKKKEHSSLTDSHEVALYKEELRQAVLDGTMSLENVKDDLTTEEFNELSDELDEVMSDEVSALTASVRAIYDPENVDRSQLEILVEKISKEFNYVDLEILVDEEPQIAADVLEYLLSERSSIKKTKAA